MPRGSGYGKRSFNLTDEAIGVEKSRPKKRKKKQIPKAAANAKAKARKNLAKDRKKTSYDFSHRTTDEHHPSPKPRTAKPKKTRVSIRPNSPASKAVTIAKSVKAPHDYAADAVDKYLSMTKSVSDAVKRKAKKGRKKFVDVTGIKIR